MNKLTLLLTFCALFAANFIQAQNKPSVRINSSDYDSLKSLNVLDLYDLLPDNSSHIQFNAGNITYQPKKKKDKKGTTITPKASGCNCYIDPDTSYILAMPPNDDGFSSVINLPFDFCFYGDTVTALYINNNGNITFGNGLSGFIPTAFPSSGNQIISPFWGDVDTRNGNGQVVYKLTPTALYVNWVDVGYFNQQGDKRNTFQLILTDGMDPVIDGGNLAFCYEDMQWTTGSASGGVNGFGGTPATAGANKGNNVDYFLLARFDHPGTDFDGALGNPDGISWLDYKSFFFDVCNTNNIPPVPNGISSCDTFRICSIGDTADYPLIFLSPEATQITSLTINNGGLTSMQTLVNNSGNTAEMVIRAWGEPSTVGTYSVTVTATDNYVPAGVTTLTFTVVIDSTGTSNFNPVLSPTSGCDEVEVGVLNGPYDSYLWPNITTDSTNIVDTTTNNYEVTVEKNGCFKKISANILVAKPVLFNLQGDLGLCPGNSDTYVYVPDSLNMGPITWGLSDPNLDSLYSNNLVAGTYTLSALDTTGLCTSDTTFTITSFQPIILQADDTTCTDIYTISGTGGSGNGLWTYTPASSTPVFQDSSDINTEIYFTESGNYQFVYTDQSCPFGDTVNLRIGVPIENQMTGENLLCPGDTAAFIYFADSLSLGSITWGLSDPGLDSLYSNILIPGNYTVVVQDTLGLCSLDSSFIVANYLPVQLPADDTICASQFNLTGIGGSGVGNGVWTYFPATLNPIFQDSNNMTTLVSFTEPGVYNLVYTDYNCPTADTITLAVGIPILSSMQGQTVLCPAVQSTDIAFVDSLHYGSITWGLSDPILDAQYSNTLSAGTYTVNIVDSIGICTFDTTFSVINYQPIQLQPDDSSCGPNYTMTGIGGSGSGSWTYYPATPMPTIQSPNNINTNVTFSEYGIYNFVFTDLNCPISDTLTLTIAMPFGNQMQGSTFYCPDDPGAYIFVPDSAHFGTVTWGNDPSLDGVFSHFLTAGQYSLYLQDTLGLCSSTQNFLVTTQPEVNLMQDTTICDSVLVMTTNQGPSTQGKWSVVSGPGAVTFQDSTFINQTISFSTFGTYVLVFKEEICQDEDTLIVTYDAGPVIQFNNIDYFVCPGDLENIYIADSADMLSAQWTNVPFGLNTLFSVNLDTGVYSLTLTNQFGCSNDTTFQITGQQKIILDPLDIVCYDSIFYQDGIGVEGGLWTMISGPGTVQFFPNDSLMTSMVFSEFGQYTVTYNEDNCNDGDTLVLDVVLFPYAEVGNIVGCLGIPETVEAFDGIGNADSYYWSNGGTGPSTVLIEGGTYVLTVENECGISEFEFEFIAEPCDIEMPNVFTPNGDGANNLFVPIAASKTAFPQFYCQIFNRWGNLISEFDDMEKGWDGTTKKGEPVSDGVYFYKVSATNLNGEEIEKEGFFHLIRN